MSRILEFIDHPNLEKIYAGKRSVSRCVRTFTLISHADFPRLRDISSGSSLFSGCHDIPGTIELTIEPERSLSFSLSFRPLAHVQCAHAAFHFTARTLDPRCNY